MTNLNMVVISKLFLLDRNEELQSVKSRLHFYFTGFYLGAIKLTICKM